MSHTPVRRTAITTVVALASGLACAQTAGAEAGSTTPTIAIGATSIDEYGPAGNLDIAVTAAPAGDAYIRFVLSGSRLGQIHSTEPPAPATVTDLKAHRIRRQPLCNGLLNQYHHAA
jgi:hypothetical protein